MNPANATNASASATTSTRTPSARHDEPAAGSRASLTEAQYLEQQASATKAAIASAFDELKSDLARGADPRVWMQSHPWITLASAAVAGFATAAAVVPSKEQVARRKLEAIERAANAARDANGHGNGAAASKTSGGFLSMIIHELFSVLKPIVLTLLAEQLKPQNSGDATTQDRPTPDANQV